MIPDIYRTIIFSFHLHDEKSNENTMGLGDFITSLASVISSIIFLAIVGLVVYVIYYCMFVAYPRFFFPGHTESSFMKDYMTQYFTDMVSYANTCIISEDQALDSIKKNASTFFATYKVAFGQDLQTTTDFSVNNCIPLHVLFMFYNDLKSNDKKSFGQAFEILKKLIQEPAISTLQSFYGTDNNIDISDTTWTTFQQLFKEFEALRSSTDSFATTSYGSPMEKPSDAASISAMMLDVMFSKYFDGSKLSSKTTDHIQRMYQMRQTGGFANFRLVKIYIGDFVDYAINQKIKKEIWGPFKEEASTLATRINDLMASDAVQNWFTDLPGNLAGTNNESFKNKYPEVSKKVEEARETFLSSPYSNDIQEPFIDQLIKIAKTFVALFEVIMSIVNIIADPIAFIKFLLGAIIAIVLYIVFTLLYILQIATAIAYVVKIAVCIFATGVWIGQIALFAIFYGLLSVIDMPLGGFIMRSLRCENLPDAWASVSNWHNANKYERTFFCSNQCKSRFYPSDLVPLLCTSQDADEPTYAPHQIIYNTYKQAEFLNKLTTKKTYSHTPDAKYYTMKVDRQKKLWEQVFKARQSYIKQCRIGTTSTSGYADYDPLVKQMCSYFANTDAISTTYDETTLDSINGLCRDVFCGDDQEGPFFCTTEEESDPVCIESDGAPPKDVIKVILFTIIAILVIFIAMYYLLNGGKIDLSFMDVGKKLASGNGIAKNIPGFTSWSDQWKGIKEAVTNVADNAAQVVKSAALHPANTIAKMI